MIHRFQKRLKITSQPRQQSIRDLGKRTYIPESIANVFHTATLACSWFLLIIVYNTTFSEAKQSFCTDTIVQSLCCSKMTDFLGRVELGAKHQALQRRFKLVCIQTQEGRCFFKHHAPVRIRHSKVQEHAHTCRILQ